MSNLQLLFQVIHQTKNEFDLQSHLAPQIGEYFAAKRSALFFFDHLVANLNLQPLDY